MTLSELMTAPQYSLDQPVKDAALLEEMRRLISHHRAACPDYARILDAMGGPDATSLATVPYLPVGLFKSHLLQSVPDSEVFKVMTSSGTTGQQVSRIVLDRDTAERQSEALAAIMTHVLGPARLPMVIVDTPNVVRDRKSFSARGVGVLGMLSYGRRHFYALNDEMELDRQGLQDFLARHGDGPILIFGFTFMVWKYLYQRLSPGEVDLSSAVLIHSGGWKKLTEEAVDNMEFKRALRAATGLNRVHNFYGMVEQVGSVFMEGPDGFLYPPNFADVIIRDPETWEPVPDGVVGVVQVLSALPTSYPGHSILTEDLGVVHGTATHAERQWAGHQLEIIGRVPRAELRGCSDTHAAEAATAS